MKINYVIAKPLEVPQGYYLINIVNEEGQGNYLIDEAFNIPNRIRPSLKMGDCVVIDNVFNLVCKKPAKEKDGILDLDAFVNCIQSMADYAFANGIRKIAFARTSFWLLTNISWDEFINLFEKAFGSATVELMICEPGTIGEIHEEKTVDEIELEFAKTIGALILDEEDILEENEILGSMKIKNKILKKRFKSGSLLNIYIKGRDRFVTSEYEMTAQAADGVWVEYVGVSSKISVDETFE